MRGAREAGARVRLREADDRYTHQAVRRAASREGCARGANARLPAQPGVRVADSRGGDLSVVAAAHESQVDLSDRVVEVLRAVHSSQFTVRSSQFAVLSSRF